MRKAGFTGAALILLIASSSVPMVLGLAGLSKPTWLSLICRNVARSAALRPRLADEANRSRNAAGNRPQHAGAGPGHALEDLTPADALRFVVIGCHRQSPSQPRWLAGARSGSARFIPGVFSGVLSIMLRMRRSPGEKRHGASAQRANSSRCRDAADDGDVNGSLIADTRTCTRRTAFKCVHGNKRRTPRSCLQKPLRASSPGE